MAKDEKKEKDLSMTDEAWNKRTGRILGFLENEENSEFLNSTPDVIDAVELINYNIPAYAVIFLYFPYKKLFTPPQFWYKKVRFNAQSY